MAEGVNGSKEDGGNSSYGYNSGRNANASVISNGNMITNQDKSKAPNANMSNGSVNTEDKVCRDFLRKVCHRGNRCKFLHPDTEDSSSSIHHHKRELIFCHDFQNGLCPRSMCRFIHCTVGEEDYYLSTGHILPHILEQATIKGQILDTTLNGEVPICKDFLMGDCLRKRGGKCRFRHLTKIEYENEVYGSRRDSDSHSSGGGHYDCSPTLENGTLPPDAKRHRFEPSQPHEFLRDPRDREFLRSKEDLSRGDLLPPREMSLREFRDRDRELDRERDRRGLEEIILLRKQLETLKKEIASLKKENSDLRATNDFLLEKVTTLGMTKAGGTVTTVTVPTVSLASTIPVATSVRPLTAAQVSHPLSITSECSVGSVVAIPPPRPPPQAQAPPQSLAPPTQQVGVAPPPTAVLGPVGGVQVSLSQAPALTAVTLSTVNLNSIAAAPATSLAPSIAPPPPGTAPNLAQGMSISGASGHLVTYPIMTQPGLRPQLQ